MRRRVAAALLLCALPASPLAAQASRVLELGAGVIATRLRTVASGGGAGQALSGMAGSGEARLFKGPVSLKAWYLQGRLAADTGLASASDLVEAGLQVAAHPVPWASFAAGPQLRAYVVPSGTERWILWVGRARLEGGIVGGTVRAHLELWAALSSSVNLARSANGARGGEAGLTARLPRSPFWARLAYAIDRATLQGGGAETLDGVALTVGFGGR